MSYNNISLNNSWVSFLNVFVIFDMLVNNSKDLRQRPIYLSILHFGFGIFHVVLYTIFKDLNPNISNLAITIAAN